MKKAVTIILLLIACYSINAQIDNRITTIDFVQILNENKEEAIFYYENNWKVLRDLALQKGYIDSYQLLETPASEDAPFQLMLITTYPNEAQYDLKEQNFTELMNEKGDLRLLNSKKPAEFRKIIYGKEAVRHIF